MLSVQHRPSWCMVPFQPPVITSEEGRSTNHALQYLKLARSIFLFLKKGKATHSNILAWRIPWTEEPGRLQSMGLQRVGHNWGCTRYDMYQYLCQHCAEWVTSGVRLKRWCELTTLFLLRCGRGDIQTQSGCVWSSSSQPQSYHASVT